MLDITTYLHNPLRKAIAAAYLQDEASCVKALMQQLDISPAQSDAITRLATQLVTQLRQTPHHNFSIDALMHEYDLSSQEGVVLMCLAEALLRIPDSDTADKLIKDKLTQSNWEQHLGHNGSLLVNAATWGLMLTGQIINLEDSVKQAPYKLIAQLVSRSGAPAIRTALKEGMRIIGHQFITGSSIEQALQKQASSAHYQQRYSYDMLGEAAITQGDAERYFQAYAHAIKVIGKHRSDDMDLVQASGISVKLSALHPRFELAQKHRLHTELLARIIALAEQARQANISLTIDAEESERLDITLDVLEALVKLPQLKDWHGLGLAVQAYQKRALPMIDWLIELARQHQQHLFVRLVKGAYWDNEIKRTQEQGLPGYPVFTRKCNTDIAYLSCAQRLLDAADVIYPQFATHNAHTIAAILHMAGSNNNFEFQRLHGMGEKLYDIVAQQHAAKIAVRVYAPVGSHTDLLPYLVRRLLENGANTSFINRIEDSRTPVSELVMHPVDQLQQYKTIANPHIPLPAELYTPQRQNSQGVCLTDPLSIDAMTRSLTAAGNNTFSAAPLINGRPVQGKPGPVHNPATGQPVGQLIQAGVSDIEHAMRTAHAAFAEWQRVSVAQRVSYLQRAADLLETHRAELVYLINQEAGRCLADALAEVREAVDYCYYYAQQAEQLLQPQKLNGPTGEDNILQYHPRGVFACISPWNFPLAIFTGQLLAALVTGNTVVAKPASQTPLTAMRVTQLLHESGIPPAALNLVPGDSKNIGAALLTHPHLAGVVFTGSTAAAQAIHRTLAQRPGSILPLIAETGGINCMLVDSSALPEQVIRDALQSAFNSAGQRCSALRVMYIQQDIYPRLRELLIGAMAELNIGHPGQLSTDMGPLIDDTARAKVIKHIERMQSAANLLYQTPLTAQHTQGHFVPASLVELNSIQQLQEEVFGPVLHLIPYRSNKLNEVIADINDTGYGLTLGIHSRIESTALEIQQQARVGNIYVNRNMIGAVVGVQPFGGEGLSGTGPKAGGPNYLLRFVTERVVSTNTVAIGGNATLLSLQQDQSGE